MINIKKHILKLLEDKGFDDLNKFLLLNGIIFIILDIIFKYLLFGILIILSFSIFFYRLFSKNNYSKVKQNRIFREIILKIKSPFMYKSNIYKKCPKCGIKLKLPVPKKRGIKHTTCPDCGKRFAFLTLRRRK